MLGDDGELGVTGVAVALPLNGAGLVVGRNGDRILRKAQGVRSPIAEAHGNVGIAFSCGGDQN